MTDAWGPVRARLEGIRKTLQAEMTAYPMPITGCDAQYNHMLEQRDAILREIGRLEDAVKAGGGEEEAAQFMRASAFFDDAAA